MAGGHGPHMLKTLALKMYNLYRKLIEFVLFWSSYLRTLLDLACLVSLSRQLIHLGVCDA